MIKISRQKIYDALIEVNNKYGSMKDIVVYVSYTDRQGVRLNMIPEYYVKRHSWLKNTLEVTDCLDKKTVFDQADAIGLKIELWIKSGKYDIRNYKR